MYAALLNPLSFVSTGTKWCYTALCFRTLEFAEILLCTPEHKSQYNNPTLLPNFIILNSHSSEHKNMLRNFYSAKRQIGSV